MYTRFALGLRGYLLHPVSIAQAREEILLQIAEREENFLRVVERAVYRHPQSPYLPLLQRAGCELGDLCQMVRRHGLEPTLRTLRAEGVYVTFEEFKGREPIVRGGLELTVRAHDFDNPLRRPDFYADSGGSTGAGTRVQHELDHLASVAAYVAVTYDAHGARGIPAALWRGVLPDGSGVDNILRGARFAFYYQRWFSHTMPSDYSGELRKHRIATQLLVAAGRVLGVQIPRPERVCFDEAVKVAGWMASMVREHGHCLLEAAVSRSLRVAIAARDAGLDLHGAIFRLGGEPVTPAKLAGIHASGATAFTTYGFSEIGRVGLDCAAPGSACNDLHLATGLCAMVPYPRRVPGTGMEVDAFLFTSLLPAAPKILLNTESDDYGLVETRGCGCPLGKLGLDTHLREVRSFGKLTGEGATLVGSDMLHILEEVLPAACGGSPLDYQLLEAEDEKGFTHLDLIVSPQVVADDDRVLEILRDAIARANPGAGVAESIWGQAGSLRVRRMEPVWTGRGKLMSLHVDRGSKPSR